MKKQKENDGHYLQTKSMRWKWMAGATAAGAAGVTVSQASTITINLTNNFISFGNHLNADLTGDGHPDLTIANAYLPSSNYFGTARVSLNGINASGYQRSSGNTWFYRMRLGLRVAHYYRHLRTTFRSSFVSGTPSLMGAIPIFFKDLHINGGAPTKGLLEVTVGTGAFIQLDSLTYTSNTPVQGSSLAKVPDEGSSLALLAMGAGGVLAFRRWRAMQQRC